MNWRELYEERDSGGDEVLDVWIKNGEAIAYQCIYRGRKVTVSGKDTLIPKAPPKRYTFMEAVALMEQGKKMRPDTHPESAWGMRDGKYACSWQYRIGDFLYPQFLTPRLVRAVWTEVPS
jgi:hypothetical protein